MPHRTLEWVSTLAPGQDKDISPPLVSLFRELEQSTTAWSDDGTRTVDDISNTATTVTERKLSTALPTSDMADYIDVSRKPRRDTMFGWGPGVALGTLPRGKTSDEAGVWPRGPTFPPGAAGPNTSHVWLPRQAPLAREIDMWRLFPRVWERNALPTDLIVPGKQLFLAKRGPLTSPTLQSLSLGDRQRLMAVVCGEGDEFFPPLCATDLPLVRKILKDPAVTGGEEIPSGHLPSVMLSATADGFDLSKLLRSPWAADNIVKVQVPRVSDSFFRPCSEARSLYGVLGALGYEKPFFEARWAGPVVEPGEVRVICEIPCRVALSRPDIDVHCWSFPPVPVWPLNYYVKDSAPPGAWLMPLELPSPAAFVLPDWTFSEALRGAKLTARANCSVHLIYDREWWPFLVLTTVPGVSIQEYEPLIASMDHLYPPNFIHFFSKKLSEFKSSSFPFVAHSTVDLDLLYALRPPQPTTTDRLREPPEVETCVACRLPSNGAFGTPLTLSAVICDVCRICAHRHCIASTWSTTAKGRNICPECLDDIKEVDKVDQSLNRPAVFLPTLPCFNCLRDNLREDSFRRLCLAFNESDSLERLIPVLRSLGIYCRLTKKHFAQPFSLQHDEVSWTHESFAQLCAATIIRLTDTLARQDKCTKKVKALVITSRSNLPRVQVPEVNIRGPTFRDIIDGATCGLDVRRHVLEHLAKGISNASATIWSVTPQRQFELVLGTDENVSLTFSKFIAERVELPSPMVFDGRRIIAPIFDSTGYLTQYESDIHISGELNELMATSDGRRLLELNVSEAQESMLKEINAAQVGLTKILTVHFPFWDKDRDELTLPDPLSCIRLCIDWDSNSVFHRFSKAEFEMKLRCHKKPIWSSILSVGRHHLAALEVAMVQLQAVEKSRLVVWEIANSSVDRNFGFRSGHSFKVPQTPEVSLKCDGIQFVKSLVPATLKFLESRRAWLEVDLQFASDQIREIEDLDEEPIQELARNFAEAFDGREVVSVIAPPAKRRCEETPPVPKPHEDTTGPEGYQGWPMSGKFAVDMKLFKAMAQIWRRYTTKENRGMQVALHYKDADVHEDLMRIRIVLKGRSDDRARTLALRKWKLKPGQTLLALYWTVNFLGTEVKEKISPPSVLHLMEAERHVYGEVMSSECQLDTLIRRIATMPQPPPPTGRRKSDRVVAPRFTSSVELLSTVEAGLKLISAVLAPCRRVHLNQMRRQQYESGRGATPTVLLSSESQILEPVEKITVVDEEVKLNYVKPINQYQKERHIERRRLNITQEVRERVHPIIERQRIVINDAPIVKRRNLERVVEEPTYRYVSSEELFNEDETPKKPKKRDGKRSRFVDGKCCRCGGLDFEVKESAKEAPKTNTKRINNKTLDRGGGVSTGAIILERRSGRYQAARCCRKGSDLFPDTKNLGWVALGGRCWCCQTDRGASRAPTIPISAACNEGCTCGGPLIYHTVLREYKN